ncbi:MAG: GAP family protein [Candidatus Nanopelagicales bacterium]|nr:GAP family protein [Candidatus Nanopelagicales bacterium]MDZ4248731.1 GAP family protein [Candidatus Nanopelagicales bacterium]
MTSLEAEVVPLALGAAVSPTLLGLQLLILSGAIRPVARAWSFALGVAIAAGAYMFVLATVAATVTLSSTHMSETERLIKLAAAALLLLLGVRALRRGKDQGKPPAKTAARLKNAGLGTFVAVGLTGMVTNFSSVVLILPATHDIMNSATSLVTQGLMLALVFFCTLAPVILPALAVTLMGSRSDRWLSAMNRFTRSHAKQINAAIAFLFAALLAYSALG